MFVTNLIPLVIPHTNPHYKSQIALPNPLTTLALITPPPPQPVGEYMIDRLRQFVLSLPVPQGHGPYKTALGILTFPLLTVLWKHLGARRSRVQWCSHMR